MKKESMRIYLIRHSLTEGNLKKRYVGKTDENLCPEGVKLLEIYCEKGGFPQVERIYASPMKRCIQTAELCYPGQQIFVIDELSECDFGLFENKNYKELSGLASYQEWVDSGGALPFPGGESREEFKKRTLSGFEKSVRECMEAGIALAAYIVHGGTVMCIMEKYAFPKKGYFHYQVGNGEGYELIIADSVCGDSRFSAGSDVGRPGIFVPSGEINWTSDYRDGKNYKKLFSKDENR